MKTLGIDLGTNSLGWAVLNETGVENTGVLVFEEGVNREQSDSLETPAAVRRAKRMARRLRFRRHLRRRLILKVLIENGMCPLKPDELRAWSQTGSFPKDNIAFLNWLKSTDTDNPYADRAAAASGKVAPEVLGRAIFHISQRRGFKSGRKDQPGEDEEVSTAKAKELGEIKGDITRISAELEKSGLTLGQHFFSEIKAGRKVRKQHTGRIEHYQKEWAKIATVQELDKPLSEKIARALFWQRPLREQSFLAGKCPLEPTHNRAQIGHPDFEEFRALSFVNNIRLVDGDRKIVLTPDQRAVAMTCFIRRSSFDFKTIRQKLEKQFKELRGAVFNYEDNQTLSPSKVTAALTELLPDGVLLQKAFDALTFFDDNEKLETWSRSKLGLSAEAAKQFVKVRIPEGRAGYSLHAIRLINRFLRKGVELSEAIFLARLPKVIPGFDKNEADIVAKVHDHNELYRENKRTSYRDTRAENRVGVLSLEKRLRSWMETDYGVNGDIFDTLYFRDPKADSSYASVKPGGTVLPPVKLGMIRNPLVQRSMTMLRRLVNDLRKSNAIDADTRIHIELARDVNSRNDRMAIKDWQKQNEEARKKARETLQQYTANPSEEEILKYVLAEEQGWVCLYTGRHISINGGGSLFPGFDIEHTLPRSRSGDDSQANKTLCEIQFNRQTKKGLMPSELGQHDEIMVRLNPWKEKIDDLKKLKEKQAKIAKGISKENPEAHSKARQKMLVTKLELRYWEDKYHRFTKRPDDITPSFISRQLVDTGIMTRHAVALLKTVYHDVYPVNGQAVAFARKLWKVQGEDEAKGRSDHTHHAKDAMVIAALSRDRFNAICAALKAEDEGGRNMTIAPPFANFAQAVFDAKEGLLVKHVTRHNELKQTKYKKPRRLSGLTKGKDGKPVTRAPAAGDTVRGQLHEETFYGKIKKPGETEPVCVIRKALASCSEKDVAAIVDPVIKKCVHDKLAQMGGDFKKAIVQDVFAMDSGVPIRKVRVFVTPHTSLNEIRRHTATPSKHDYKNPVYACTAAGSNLAVAVYRVPLRAQPEFVIEKLLDAVRDVTSQPSGTELLGRILPGAMALALSESGSALPRSKTPVLLYKVRKFDKNSITLWFHREARAKKDLESDLKAAGKSSGGSSSIDYKNPHEALCLNLKKAWASFLFEGIHFKMGLDGKIEYFTGAN